MPRIQIREVIPPAPAPSSEDGKAIVAWVQESFIKYGQLLQERETLQLTETNVEPTKPREGMVAFADGTNWDPGDGRGYYVYSGGAWKILNFDATTLGAYLEKAQNLNDVANKATSRANLAVLGIAANLSDVADADTSLDNIGGVHVAGDTMEGVLKTADTTGDLNQGGSTSQGFEVRGVDNSDTDAAIMTFHRPQKYSTYFGLDTDNKFK